MDSNHPVSGTEKVEMDIPEVEESLKNGEDATEDILCCVCERKSSGAHKCNICYRFVHAICRKLSHLEEEGYEISVLYNLCLKREDVVDHQKKVYEGLRKQANKTMDLSNKKLQEIEVGSSVKIQLLNIDRSKGDARNVIGVVNEKMQDGFYKVGTTKGCLLYTSRCV